MIAPCRTAGNGEALIREGVHHERGRPRRPDPPCILARLLPDAANLVGRSVREAPREREQHPICPEVPKPRDDQRPVDGVQPCSRLERSWISSPTRQPVQESCRRGVACGRSATGHPKPSCARPHSIRLGDGHHSAVRPASRMPYRMSERAPNRTGGWGPSPGSRGRFRLIFGSRTGTSSSSTSVVIRPISLSSRWLPSFRR